MDAVREQLNKPLVAAVVAFVIGLLLGWFLLGWGLFPVTWSDAAPEHLRADLKENYLRMAIDSYSVNRDAALAQARYAELGEDAPEVLASVMADPGTQSAESIVAFSSIVTGSAPVAVGTQPVSGTPGSAIPLPGTQAPGLEGTEVAAGTTEEQPASSNLMRVVLPILCGVTLLLAAVLVGAFFLRQRMSGASPRPAASTPAVQAQQAARQAEWTDYSALGEEAPMVQFMASYKLGDDLFDDSFSIDSPSGEFMGECGVGISETIGVGDPKKVAAFEVWLFDKNDIQTVTKVLMSANAYADETTRQRLAAKGEPVLVEPGTETTLETQSLRLVVRAVDMGYGNGSMPANSFFDRLILELAVWPKA